VLLEFFENSVWFGELPRGLLAEDAAAIDADFKDPACGRDQLERAEVQLEPKDFLRQTDGLGLIVSSRAVLDDDFRFHAP
jgi:hypothetical protein